MIPKTPGTYMLMLRLPSQFDVEVGRTRRVVLKPGLYCYVGSALGPGGLAARLVRHASGGVPRHWHIDYLLPHAQLAGALLVEDPDRRECTWASWAAGIASACVSGFGASDCNCKGHLFYLGEALNEGPFVAQAQSDLHARFFPGEVLR